MKAFIVLVLVVIALFTGYLAKKEYDNTMSKKAALELRIKLDSIENKYRK